MYLRGGILMVELDKRVLSKHDERKVSRSLEGVSAPVFEDMMPGEAKPVTPAVSDRFTPSDNGDTNAVPSGGNAYIEGLEAANELAEEGRKKARILGIVMAVIAAGDLFVIGIDALETSVLMMYGAYRFMKHASGGCQVYLAIMAVLLVIKGINSIALVDSMTYGYAQRGITWVISVVQFVLIIRTAVLVITAYFLIFDKSVNAYCRLP